MFLLNQQEITITEKGFKLTLFYILTNIVSCIHLFQPVNSTKMAALMQQIFIKSCDTLFIKDFNY